ncbi:alpha/beta fold hydrolase [Rubrivirga sp. S365]|uniref:Alpha/beta fold hydrolase n=1 Tax=Rubrivirga litoralis TaxID=3075598 RepID=A0ABU3BTF8_9BACT|nr:MULTISPECIES: alpha/beta fold hydrolase [unclassified Rubrivirga]MDT0632578.1 alpha/beta fold hydrolase [Rubrivirga sp. F394]MDT7856732.1 alpha/beta fold hydrolase [Rubrivirga sp. S365]
MTLDHVGIALSDPEQEAVFRRLLDAAPYKTEAVEREGVATTFFGDGGQGGAAPKLELLEATRDDSPVATFVAKRGPGVHHLAFEVGDLEAEMERVRAAGFRPLADAPKPGADGKRIVFLHPKDTAGVLVELVQSVRPAPAWTTLATDTGDRAVQVSGPDDGPPLVVLHGALGSTELETDRLVRVWERTFHVHALDFAGHGRSAATPPDGPPTWETYTADAVALLDSLDRPARVFGFSMGGAVALAAALARPALVGRLAVHGANVQWNQAEVEAMVGPMAPERMAEATPFWARRLEETHGAGWRGLVADLVAFTRGLPDAWLEDADLARIACPTLVSAGDRDRYFDVRHAVGLWRAVPDARLQILPGLDHPIQGVDVPTFAGGVADFLLA